MTLIEAALSAESRAESRSANKSKAKKSSRPSQTKQTLLSVGNTPMVQQADMAKQTVTTNHTPATAEPQLSNQQLAVTQSECTQHYSTSIEQIRQIIFDYEVEHTVQFVNLKVYPGFNKHRCMYCAIKVKLIANLIYFSLKMSRDWSYIINVEVCTYIMWMVLNNVVLRLQR